MKDEDLKTYGPYGEVVTFTDITARLRLTLDNTMLALAKHRHAYRDSLAHLSPSLISPPMAEEDRALVTCEVCRDARTLISHLQEQITNVKIDFMTTTMEREAREQR